MYTNTRRKDKKDTSVFSCGMKGSLIDCNTQPTLVQFHKYISHTKDFKVKNWFDSFEGNKAGSISQTCRNTLEYNEFKLSKENNQLVVMNRIEVPNSRIKYKDSETIITKMSCLSQDLQDTSLIYSCSPQSLPCLIKQETDALISSDSLSNTTVNYCFPYNSRDTDSEIYSDTDVNLLRFLNRWTLLKENVSDYHSAYTQKYLDISFSFSDKCKEFNNKIKMNKEAQKRNQEVQTSSDLLSPDIVYRRAIKKFGIVDFTMNKSQNTDDLHFDDNFPITEDKSPITEDYSPIPEDNSFITEDNSFITENNSNIYSTDSLSDFNRQKSINTKSIEEVMQQPEPCRTSSDGDKHSSSEYCTSFESEPDFNDKINGLKAITVEEMKNKYKDAIRVITKNKLEFHRQKSEIFESFGENENFFEDNSKEETFKDMDKYVPLPSSTIKFESEVNNKLIPKNELSSNTADMPLKKIHHKNTNNNNITKNKCVKSDHLANTTKYKHAFRKLKTNSAPLRGTISSATERKDKCSLPCDDIDFSLSFTNDYSSSSKKVLNSNDIVVEENIINEFLDLFKEIVVNSESPQIRKGDLRFTSTDDLKLQTNTENSQKTSESEKILLDSGEPAVLFNRCGFPLTDLKGRKLKNIFGTELLPVKNMDELISSQLSVYDCFNVSIKHKNFNPINGLKQQKIQIVGKNNEPAILYNSLGYPLNDEDGVLLHDSRGNLMVILDKSGSPLCCVNNDSIYLRDGTSWANVKDYYNVFHYAKGGNALNSSYKMEKNDNYSSSIGRSYHLPDIEKFYDFENQIKSTVIQSKCSDLPSHMEQLSGFSQIISEIELSLEVSDYYKSLLMEHLKYTHKGTTN